MKTTRNLTLLLIPAIVAGCAEEPSLYRDVYASKEACLQDWNTEDLCKGIPSAEQQAVRSSGGYVHPVYYYGPHYYHGDRSVEYAGRTFRPASNFSAGSAFNTRTSNIASARALVAGVKSSPSTASARVGGFGSTARGMSVSSGGG